MITGPKRNIESDPHPSGPHCPSRLYSVSFIFTEIFISRRGLRKKGAQLYNCSSI